MNFFETFQKELISLGFSLLAAFIFWLFRARTRLRWANTHSFSFIIQPPLQQAGPAFTVQTSSFWLANLGRVVATEVEVTFNYRPDNLQVWPVRPYETIASPDNRFTLRFRNLAPRENFQIELLSINMPELLNVRCAEGVGKFLLMRPYQVFPGWFVGVVRVLIFLGFAAVFYTLLKLGAYAVAISAIPPG